ncbi:hypothetical protein NDU88_001271 [Pleurodeles waltl]|uniref:Uncharacterized protein n=1 Tax=Pleurodeles waltl TaxID=8319 RepID=A0AAV7LCM6_PLEWA|nr:hypothetical protein NDU88_001271 [Pleurodeles waltl]
MQGTGPSSPVRKLSTDSSMLPWAQEPAEAPVKAGRHGNFSSHDQVVAVIEVADDSSDLVSSALQDKVLLQIDAISDDNGPFYINAGDSKKARVATKQLQVAVSKIAKSCSETGERIATTEARADVLETDLGAVAQQAAMHDTQLSDNQWKIDDFENRQRRNNLLILGIQEGTEGQDARAYIIRLLKAAFPEQYGWDWEKEIQRAHRFP